MATPDRPVLIVEDDRDLAETLAQIIEEEGYSVVVASNGQDALELMERGKCHPSIILLDLMMPVMDGWEFHKRIGGAAASIPIVVCTADGHAREKADSMKAAGHLSKPPTIDALLRVVESFCGPPASAGGHGS